jgi:hypothetical protein
MNNCELTYRFAERVTVSFVVLLLCLPLAGCGGSTHYVDLTYPPMEAVTVEAANEAVRDLLSKDRTIILTVNDGRLVKDRVGTVGSEFGVEGSIITGENIVVWTFNAIEYELGQIGYHVVDSFNAPADPGAHHLVVDVLEVQCAVVGLYTSKLSLRVALDRSDGDPLAAEFPARVQTAVNIWWISGWAAESLAQALQKSIRMMIFEFGFDESQYASDSSANLASP